MPTYRTETDARNAAEIDRAVAAMKARRERDAAALLGRDLTEDECDSLHADGCGELACVHCYPTNADLAADFTAFRADMIAMPADPAPTAEELDAMARAAADLPW